MNRNHCFPQRYVPATAQRSTAPAPFDYSTNSRPSALSPQPGTVLAAPESGAAIVPPQPGAATAPPESADMAAGASIPETLANPAFVPGYLYTQIGKVVRVEFLIGNQTTDRVGRLAEVGASYILLQDISGDSTILCDLFSIKFVTIVNVDPGDAIIIP